jgi:hypothetical protein
VFHVLFYTIRNFNLEVKYYAIIITIFNLKGMNSKMLAKEIKEVRREGIVNLVMTAYFMDMSLRARELLNVINKIIV